MVTGRFPGSRVRVTGLPAGGHPRAEPGASIRSPVRFRRPEERYAVQDPTSSAWRYQLSRIGRHVHWARTQGVGRLVEEDQLDPRARASLVLSKWRWRRAHGLRPGSATAVYIVGVQRSGTNMLLHGLEAAPEFEVRNENDRRAFDRFRLRRERVAPLVTASRHRFVLFKPLCDSHDTDLLLDTLPVPRPAKAIWAYRSVDDRVRSSLAKFGADNLEVLSEIAAGRGMDRWQAGRLSAANLELVRGFDYSRMSAESASALFWLVRNALFFELGLDRRDDVTLASHDAFVADPQRSMRALCAFLDFPYVPRLVAHIEARSKPGRAPLEIDPEIRRRCDEMQSRLDAALDVALARTGGSISSP